MKEKKLTIKRHILLRNYLQAAKNESQKKSRTYKYCKKDSDSLFSVELNGKGGLNAKKKIPTYKIYVMESVHSSKAIIWPGNITSEYYLWMLR